MVSFVYDIQKPVAWIVAADSLFAIRLVAISS